MESPSKPGRTNWGGVLGNGDLHIGSFVTDHDIAEANIWAGENLDNPQAADVLASSFTGAGDKYGTCDVCGYSGYDVNGFSPSPADLVDLDTLAMFGNYTGNVEGTNIQSDPNYSDPYGPLPADAWLLTGKTPSWTGNSSPAAPVWKSGSGSSMVEGSMEIYNYDPCYWSSSDCGARFAVPGTTVTVVTPSGVHVINP